MVSREFQADPQTPVEFRCEVAPLYAIADVDTWGEAQIEALIENWQSWGVECIQLRAKNLAGRRLEELAERCFARLTGSTQFWINDHPQLAGSLGATGVHLGQQDMPPREARRLLGRAQCIGRSTHDLGQALAAEADPHVDVVAVGPIFETRSKADPDPPVGLSGLKMICERTTKPVIAIGGIGPDAATEVLMAGASSVAMIGALNTDAPERTIRHLLESLNAVSHSAR